MSAAPLVHAIQERLREAGYRDITTPFRIAGVEFAFTAAMRGHEARALDLILLFDTTTGDFGDREAARVRQRVEALSRALDVTGSRYVVTAILAGALLAETVEALAETCRVLQVEGVAIGADGKPADDVAMRQLEDQIRVLLPLRLPEGTAESQDGNGPAVEQLVRALPATNKALLNAVIIASEQGEQAVTDAAGLAVGAPFRGDEGVQPL
ncbi:hypothetical protein LZK98_09340 [Sphingomonas cannabina]|uniref:hypothetical protein n=1 Tax=Sphingomonas cannabina TaxID=2899123 RepID=UPI001F2BC929|nr:hypothetical protein [Sphingomonas cannabina]UIJ47123.1 hypothetical protein LZK98_09340 [Sphingomonas cannabina]